MSKIVKLPESLIRLIAAGEVIERPASVVKELVENSLDAGATQISIDVWGGGRSRIRVADNGSGMSREDAELALDRHATSKLHAFEDLHQLSTFGFRGEALPSIAAVSHLELITREAQAKEGWQQKIEGGKLISKGFVGIPPGTAIDVQDLFFNTPARSKFMKRDSTERAHILRTLQELALANPQVGFQVTMDGKAAMALNAASSRKSRLVDLWDTAVTENLVPLKFSQGPLAVAGFINAVPAHHPSKNYQHLFVNGRPVQQRLLAHAIYEAYHEWLPIGRHPVFALFLDIDPAVIDVNVHPTKREVRFSNERMIYDLLFSKIRGVLQGRGDVPVIGRSFTTPTPQFIDSSFPSFSGTSHSTNLAEAAVLVADAPVTTRVPVGELKILGQFQKLFVLVEAGQELLIVDQHAAAERVLYEKLLGQSKTKGAATQPLLTPYVWELPPDRAERIREAQPSLEHMGFGIEAFGTNAFALKEWPSVFPQLRDAKRFLEIFMDSLEAESHDPDEHAAHETVARAACRAAIKANDTLAAPEMQHLLKELFACERPMTCPHGRPTHIRLPFSELLRRFHRT